MMRLTKKKLPAIVVIGTLLSATAVFAAIKIAKKTTRANGHLKKEDNSQFQIVSDDLVNFGSITQAQKVAIQNALATAKAARPADRYFGSREDHGELKTVLEGLVNSGTITEAQEVAIQSAIERAKKQPAQQMAI